MNRGTFVSLLALSCVLVLLTSHLYPQKVFLKAADGKSPSDFQKVWDDWIGRVNREVSAAIDISHGLSPDKKKSLNGLLSENLVRSGFQLLFNIATGLFYLLKREFLAVSRFQVGPCHR